MSDAVARAGTSRQSTRRQGAVTRAHVEARLRHEIVAAARRMAEHGLVVGTVGNVSARLGDGVLITPTHSRYDLLQAEALCRVGSDGTLQEGGKRPSRELPLHLEIYRVRPDVEAVVHTHSLHATAWSFLGRPLRPRLEDLDYHEVGEVRTSAPAQAGTPELAQQAVAALADSRAALIGGHGVVAVGCELWQALTIAQLVERQATVACLLQGLGWPG
jgi:L-fuculose-phosphate aldolase